MSVDAMGVPAFESWAVLELMGHRRISGYVREVVLAAQNLLRVEMPEDDAGTALTQFYTPSALYCLTPCSEATARAALRLSRPEPVSKWEIERVRQLECRALPTPDAICSGCGEEKENCRCGDCADCAAGPNEPHDSECPQTESEQENETEDLGDSQADGHREDDDDEDLGDPGA